MLQPQTIQDQQKLALAVVAQYQRQTQQHDTQLPDTIDFTNESQVMPEPSYSQPTLKNYSSIQDIASDEDDSDQDRF